MKCHKYAEELRQTAKKIGTFPAEVQEAFSLLIKAFELMENNGERIVNSEFVYALADRLHSEAFEILCQESFKEG